MIFARTDTDSWYVISFQQEETELLRKNSWKRFQNNILTSDLLHSKNAYWTLLQFSLIPWASGFKQSLGLDPNYKKKITTKQMNEGTHEWKERINQPLIQIVHQSVILYSVSQSFCFQLVKQSVSQSVFSQSVSLYSVSHSVSNSVFSQSLWSVSQSCESIN